MGEWIRKNRKEVFQGHRVKVYEDELVRPDGETVFYDLVENRDGAAILLVDENENLIFVKQYRNVLDSETMEIPAGSLDPGDTDFLVTALREAEEETGFVPQKTDYITTMLASSGLFTEKTAVYIGTELRPGKIHRDPDEFINVIHVPLEKACQMIYRGELCDAKTILAILAYRDMKTKKIVEHINKI